MEHTMKNIFESFFFVADFFASVINLFVPPPPPFQVHKSHDKCYGGTVTSADRQAEV